MKIYKLNSVINGIVGAAIMCTIYWGLVCFVPIMRMTGEERPYYLDGIMLGVQILVYVINDIVAYRKSAETLRGSVLILMLPFISVLGGFGCWAVHNDLGMCFQGYFRYLVIWILLLAVHIAKIECIKKGFGSIWEKEKSFYFVVLAAFMVKLTYWHTIWSSVKMPPSMNVLIFNILFQTLVYFVLKILMKIKCDETYLGAYVVFGGMAVVVICMPYLLEFDGFGVAACFIYAIFEIGIIVPTVWVSLIVNKVKKKINLKVE